MERKEIQAKFAALEARRRDVAAKLDQNARRLESLEEERAALLGDSTLAQRSIADLDEYAERLREELAAMEVEEARAALADAVHERDAAIDRAAAAAADVAAAVERIAGARAVVATTHRRLREIDPSAPRDLPPEPTAFDERWHGVAPLLENELGRQLEVELVDAAVRSPRVDAVDDLPAHLRELARARKRSLLRAATREQQR